MQHAVISDECGRPTATESHARRYAAAEIHRDIRCVRRDRGQCQAARECAGIAHEITAARVVYRHGNPLPAADGLLSKRSRRASHQYASA